MRRLAIPQRCHGRLAGWTIPWTIETPQDPQSPIAAAAREESIGLGWAWVGLEVFKDIHGMNNAGWGNPLSCGDHENKAGS